MADGVGTDMGDDGTGHGRFGSKVVRRAHDGAARGRQGGVATCQASFDRYIMYVGPVLINVFSVDLVEYSISRAGRRDFAQPALPSPPSRKPVRERGVAMLSSARPCH
ncbi:conserved hypothetical protein [Burkholderia vietnamiensis]|nr:conserved hypothetical protein [Burkholderia vietnamiensis]